jgi:prolipoprotein diacylglyceryltransferase
LFGVVLGVVLLWRALRSTATNTRTTVVLYVGWIAVFAWYWFNRFAVNEVHSLDPEKIAREQVQQTALSISIFLVWVGLYLIGPIQTARRLRH